MAHYGSAVAAVQARGGSEDIDFQDKEAPATKRLKRMISANSDKEEKPLAVKGHPLLDHVIFQATCGGMVFLNTLQMGFEAEVGKETFSDFFFICEHIFTAAFLVEMIIKLACLRFSYFADKWNRLDAFVTIMGVVDLWVLPLFSTSGDYFSNLSILRVLRLARLVRILKLMKQFKKIVIIINGVADAIRTTLWVALLLFGAIYVCAIFCVDVIGRADGVSDLYPGYEEDEAEFAKFEVFSEFNPYLSFGSMYKAMLTLFNIAILAEWTEVVRPISVKQPYLIVFFILFGLFITFGVMNVIIGLIVDNVMANARAMSTEEASKDTENKIMVVKKIDRIFRDLDDDHNGVVTMDEIIKSGTDGPLSALMAEGGIGLDITPEEFFGVLDDDGDGEVSADTFVHALYKLLGVDQNRQLNCVLLALKQVLHCTRSTKDECRSRLDRIETSLNRMMDTAGGPRPPDVSSHTARMPASSSSASNRYNEANPEVQAPQNPVPVVSELECDVVVESAKAEDSESAAEVSGGSRAAKQEKLVHGPRLVMDNTRSKHDIYTNQNTELERLGRALEGMRRLDSDGQLHMDNATVRSMEEVSRILEAARREAEDAIQCKLRETIAGCLKVVRHAVEASGIELPNADLLQLNQLAQVSVVPPNGGNVHVYPPGSRNSAGSAASSSTRAQL